MRPYSMPRLNAGSATACNVALGVVTLNLLYVYRSSGFEFPSKDGTLTTSCPQQASQQ